MKNDINVEKAWENQLTRRIDELNIENLELWGLLETMAGLTMDVLGVNKGMPYGEWMELVTRCAKMFLFVEERLDKEGRRINNE